MKSHLPNFIIAGVMKGSSSATAHNLNKNIDVYCLTAKNKEMINAHYGVDITAFKGGLANSVSKELDFFNKWVNYKQGIEFYKQYFPYYRIAMGEASPNYFYVNEPWHENTIKRMKRDIPNAKIIIILRDPITRAFSHWNHTQQPGIKFGTQFKDLTFNECTEQWETPENNSLIQRSLYLENLNSYRDAFGAENVYVTTQEAVKASNLDEYNKIYNFLGVPTLDSDPGYRDVHSREYDTTIDDSSLAFLKTYFKSDVDGVKALYPDLDYSTWYTY
jgi:hypothetical protein